MAPVIIPTAAAATPPLSKQEKGRLKKLLKRSRADLSQHGFSGLASIDDLEELVALLRRSYAADGSNILDSIGPSIYARAERETVKGRDQRDLLHSLWQSEGQVGLAGKKRTRNNETISRKIPSWATIHNRACVQSVAVLEVHVDGTLAGMMQLLGRLQQEAAADKLNTLTLPTLWFEEKDFSPQSISEILMYAPPLSRPTIPLTNPPENLSDLAKVLTTFALTPPQLTTEGYPLVDMTVFVETKCRAVGDCSPTPWVTLASSLKEAKAYVQAFHVQPCASFDIDDAIDDSLPRYVSKRLIEAAAHKSNAVADGSGVPSNIYGMDCEMVQTTCGSELARITIVKLVWVDALVDDATTIQTETVLDTLVRPQHAIVDYLTAYSGVTAELLEPVTVRLEHVQAALLNLFVEPHDLLVGHSLENDLRACRWIPSMGLVDTALLFRGSQHHRRFKYSLRHLAKQLLFRDIQNHGAHCSAQDAIAALELAFRRAMQGPSFGLSKQQQAPVHGLAGVTGTTVAVGPSDWLKQHVTNVPTAAHALACESVDDANGKAIASWLCGPNRRARVVWAHWKIASLREQDELMAVIHNILSKRTASRSVVAVALQLNYDKTNEMGRERRARRNPKATMVWSELDEANWGRAKGDSRRGFVMWIGTRRPDD